MGGRCEGWVGGRCGGGWEAGAGVGREVVTASEKLFREAPQ